MWTERNDKGRDGSSWTVRLALGSSVVLLGLSTFAVSLIQAMPVRFAARLAGSPVADDQLSGTVWQGDFRINADHDLSWRLDAWGSLLHLGAVFDVALTGPGTDLAGALSMDGAVLGAMGPLSGTVAWPLVEAVLADLPIRCDVSADVQGLTLSGAIGGHAGDGTASTAGGQCSRIDGSVDPLPVPALTARIATLPEGVEATLTRTDAPDTALAVARLTNDDRIVVTVHPEGAAMIPGMPATSDSEIELPLSVLMP